jgi:HK97 family phage prohead protease
VTTIATERLTLPPRFNEVQHREATVEDVDPDAGTILVRAAPYGVETALAHDLFEQFERAAFAKAANAPSRVKAWHEHNGPLIGHALSVEDRPDGVWVKTKIANTIAGGEVRELARDGILTDVSVTFRPMKDHMRVARRSDGLHVSHSRAHLLGFAFVSHGAYAEHAFVASVRDEKASREREQIVARLRALTH